MSDESHVSDSAGAYVLGALTAEEAHEVETHAAVCETCHQEISDLKHVVSVLPLACSSVEPSPDLKARILAASRGEDEVGAILRRAVVSSQRADVRHGFWRRSFPSWAGVAGWVGVGAACVVGGIFIGVANEHHRMIAALPSQQAQPQLAAANAPVTLGRVTAQKTVAEDAYMVSAERLDPRVAFIGESQVWDLSLSKTGQRIPCKVIQPPNGSNAMIVADMPKAEHGMIYRVWLVRKGEMHRGGTVMPGMMMQSTMPMKVQSGDVIAFSMESPNGSAASGPFVYEQTL